MDKQDLIALARKLTPGARRALFRMTDEWQFCGKSTFDANGAHALHWARNAGGWGAIAECEMQKDGKWSRWAYRLTPKGIALRAIASQEGK